MAVPLVASWIIYSSPPEPEDIEARKGPSQELPHRDQAFLEEIRHDMEAQQPTSNLSVLWGTFEIRAQRIFCFQISFVRLTVAYLAFFVVSQALFLLESSLVFAMLISLLVLGIAVYRAHRREERSIRDISLKE